MSIARLIWTLRDGEYHTSKDIADNLGIPREQAVNLVKCLVEYNGGVVVAARNLNRKFVGIELDEDYFNIAVERVNGV